MKKTLLSLFALLFIFTAFASAQNKADEKIIRERARDYIEGFFTADAERMDRALAPDLAKRIINKHRGTGKSLIGLMSKSLLVEYTRGNAERAKLQETIDKMAKVKVTILDIDGDMASVKIVSPDFNDYLHLGKWNGEWKIINVLWRMKEK